MVHIKRYEYFTITSVSWRGSTLGTSDNRYFASCKIEMVMDSSPHGIKKKKKKKCHAKKKGTSETKRGRQKTPIEDDPQNSVPLPLCHAMISLKQEKKKE